MKMKKYLPFLSVFALLAAVFMPKAIEAARASGALPVLDAGIWNGKEICLTDFFFYSIIKNNY